MRRTGPLARLWNPGARDLRDAPLTASREEVIALSRLHARLLNSPDEEDAAAVESVCRTLAHPLLRRAAAATERHREYPLLYRTASGLLLEGILDLVFGENGSWMVIDFKTDARDSRYQRQLQWYVYAFSQVTGRASEWDHTPGLKPYRGKIDENSRPGIDHSTGATQRYRCSAEGTSHPLN